MSSAGSSLSIVLVSWHFDFFGSGLPAVCLQPCCALEALILRAPISLHILSSATAALSQAGFNSNQLLH
jgi:hypothetical protein